MRYLYYPGCALKCSGRAYEESLLPMFEALGVTFEEIPDWNCCGATAYTSVSEHAAFSLALRNLALAERHAPESTGPVDLVAPCAACYLVLAKAQRSIAERRPNGPSPLDRLADAGLSYSGRVRLRHPLDVLVNDVGLDRVSARVERPLAGLKVASYYGCQIVRPYATFDDPYRPTSMDRLMAALGAEPVDWPLKTRCCGGTLTATIREVGQRLNELLAQEAAGRGAQVIATACPLCQFNLESQQGAGARRGGASGPLPTAYFTQLAGIAFGLNPRRIGLHRLLVPVRPTLEALEGARHV